jgi:hypothetical protein
MDRLRAKGRGGNSARSYRDRHTPGGSYFPVTTDELRGEVDTYYDLRDLNYDDDAGGRAHRALERRAAAATATADAQAGGGYIVTEDGEWPSLQHGDALGAAAKEWELVGDEEHEEDGWEWVSDDGEEGKGDNEASGAPKPTLAALLRGISEGARSGDLDADEYVCVWCVFGVCGCAHIFFGALLMFV